LAICCVFSSDPVVKELKIQKQKVFGCKFFLDKNKFTRFAAKMCQTKVKLSQKFSVIQFHFFFFGEVNITRIREGSTVQAA
jgi:hypothetical protein